MNKIALIMPYFGKFPNYFELWLKSASYNETIDFYIFTDIEYDKYLPKNVHIVNMTFDEIKKRAQSIVDFSIVLNDYYKLCDYKPAYGLIFSDYLEEYDFWGHCDPDIIWGNIRNFLTEDILNEYDRVFTFGHLSVYRNNNTINNSFKYNKQDVGHDKYISTYEDAFKTSYICHFDEWGGYSRYAELKGINQYDERPFADIDATRFAFYTSDVNDKVGQVFSYKLGELIGYWIENGVIKSKEYAYIHLQKRSMQLNIGKNEMEKFLIVPNKFIPYSDIDIKKISEYGKNKVYFAWYRKRVNMIIDNIKKGAIKRRIDRALNIRRKNESNSINTNV